MSTIQVANINFESTGNTRIQYLGANNVAVVAGGQNTIIANSTQVQIPAGIGLSANGSLGTSGQVLTSNATAIFWATTGANVQTFTASGTWTKPSSGTLALIKCWGAGGSGAGGNSAGNAGAGGSYVETAILLSTLGSTETVTIGTGGVASNSTNSGSSGGTTTFGSRVSAYGGAGAVNATSNGAHSGSPYMAPSTKGCLFPTLSTNNAVYPGPFDFIYGPSDGTAVYIQGDYPYGGGLGQSVYNNNACSPRTVYFYRHYLGINGYGGTGGIQTIPSDASNRAHSYAGPVTGWTLSFSSNAYWAGANSFLGGGGAGGGAGATGAVAYPLGGVSVGGFSGNGGHGANSTVAATGGFQPGGGGGGGFGSSNATISAGAAGGNGQCIVIVI